MKNFINAYNYKTTQEVLDNASEDQLDKMFAWLGFMTFYLGFILGLLIFKF